MYLITFPSVFVSPLVVISYVPREVRERVGRHKIKLFPALIGWLIYFVNLGGLKKIFQFVSPKTRVHSIFFPPPPPLPAGSFHPLPHNKWNSASLESLADVCSGVSIKRGNFCVVNFPVCPNIGRGSLEGHRRLIGEGGGDFCFDKDWTKKEGRKNFLREDDVSCPRRWCFFSEWTAKKKGKMWSRRLSVKKLRIQRTDETLILWSIGSTGSDSRVNWVSCLARDLGSRLRLRQWKTISPRRRRRPN